MAANIMETLNMVKKRLNNLNIPLIYEKFPETFKRDINGWSFPDAQEKISIDVELTDEEVSELKEQGLLTNIQRYSK